MPSAYHSGELETQARAGGRATAQRVGQMIRSLIPPAAQVFLGSQRMAVLSTVDAGNRVWASLLTGKPGFMQAADDRTVRIGATPVAGDPLSDNLRATDHVGLLAIDFATRRRLRVNGTAERRPDVALYLQAREVYGNCPKYIQARQYDRSAVGAREAPTLRHTGTLTEDQQRWIARADTFFFASFHPEGGADASHRGGPPGFVRIASGQRLVWPDYAGNMMFQTIGNIVANPRAGLLFLDFESGRTLQVTGNASILWDADRAVEFGGERLIEFHIEQAIEIGNAFSLRWKCVGYPPFDPA
jgi:predicted pyridoxine 5'-phosphate oxidase superfamily flavin-nucleotide-binding protein